jgi:hypothetical protein
VWEFARAIKVGELFSNPMPLEPSRNFLDVALDDIATYEELYLCGLQNGDYNVQLSDFSYLQFGISKDHHVRYAYYPNPFLGSSSRVVAEVNELREFVKEGLVTVEEFLHRVSEIRTSQHAPLIRYENAPDDYREGTHPCSHFHFGHHSDNRWQVQRVISPLAFSMIVFQQFQSTKWSEKKSVSVFGRQDIPTRFLAAEKLNCPILPDELLSQMDRELFTFA